MLNDDWEITKSGFARHNLLNLVFLVTVNWKKLMPCSYFTLFLFMFVLKLQLLKLKHSWIWLWKQLGKNGNQNASVWNVGKCKQLHKVLPEMLSGLPWLQPIHRPNLVSLPTTHTSCADVGAQGLDGAQPTLITTALYSPLQVLEFEMTSLTCF